MMPTGKSNFPDRTVEIFSEAFDIHTFNGNFFAKDMK